MRVERFYGSEEHQALLKEIAELARLAGLTFIPHRQPIRMPYSGGYVPATSTGDVPFVPSHGVLL